MRTVFAKDGFRFLLDQPVSARHENGKIHIAVESGLEIAIPVEGNPRLAGKPHDQLDRIELSPFGLHWSDLDEDLSIPGILASDYGQRTGQAA